jgi:hypothetical protein
MPRQGCPVASMQMWACLLPMAFSQDSTSFQPSGLLAKILACWRWPLAQLASKVSLDTSIPTIESLTICYHDRGWTQQGSASDHLVREISGLSRPWIPFGMNSGARRSRAIYTAQVRTGGIPAYDSHLGCLTRQR